MDVSLNGRVIAMRFQVADLAAASRNGTWTTHRDSV
jgi:hypothetical protein